MEGWISLHRKIMEHPEYFSEKFTRMSAWIDLLLLANHKIGYLRKRGIKVEVKRGQTAVGRDQFAERWQWSAGKVRRFLNELEKENQIVQHKNNVINLISIVNYDKYQINDTADNATNNTADSTGDRTADGRQTEQQTDANNNDNKNNNENKEEIEIEKPLVFPFTSELFFEKWNLLVSTDKWKVKKNYSLQIALDTLSKFDEAFAIEMINQAIAGDWNQFKGFELQEYFHKWNKQKTAKPEKSKQSHFKPPTLEMVQEYCKKRNNSVDAIKFVNFYASKNWMIGKNKMKDWEAAVRTWEQEEKQKGKPVVNIEAIERAKALEEKNKSDRIKAEKLKEYAQKFCMDLLKKENPDMEKDELFPLWDKTWKQEYNQLCDKYGIDKHYKL